jgi:pyruvate kinase
VHVLQVVRKTKIVATAGPSCADAVTMHQMVEAGMDVLRVNLGHTDQIDPGAVIAHYRKACSELGRLPCVCVDLKGSELRSCWLIDKQTKERVDSIRLKAGQKVTLFGSTAQEKDSFVGWEDGNSTRIGIGCENLGQLVLEDNIVRMADGSIAIRVESIVTNNEVIGIVEGDCTLGNHKMVSIVNLKIHPPFLNAKDEADIKWAVHEGVNFLTASFTRSGEDVTQLQEILHNCPGGSDVRYATCVPCILAFD